jgi:hypothetical protein
MVLVGLDSVMRTTELADSESTTDARMVTSKIKEDDCILFFTTLMYGGFVFIEPDIVIKRGLAK